MRPLQLPGTDDRVFPTVVTDRTRLSDFHRAGIARRVVVRDEAGAPIMVGKGKRQRPKTILTTEDADGRIADLHALRATLGTMLARQGVTPQVAQRLLRHSDYRTTLSHYTVLTLADSARAIESIELPRVNEAKATGTTDESDHRNGVSAGVSATRSQPYPTVRNDAHRPRHGEGARCADNTCEYGTLCVDDHANALSFSKAGDRNRTGDIQLGKLTFYR